MKISNLKIELSVILYHSLGNLSQSVDSSNVPSVDSSKFLRLCGGGGEAVNESSSSLGVFADSSSPGLSNDLDLSLLGRAVESN